MPSAVGAPAKIWSSTRHTGSQSLLHQLMCFSSSQKSAPSAAAHQPWRSPPVGARLTCMAAEAGCARQLPLPQCCQWLLETCRAGAPPWSSCLSWSPLRERRQRVRMAHQVLSVRDQPLPPVSRSDRGHDVMWAPSREALPSSQSCNRHEQVVPVITDSIEGALHS